MKRNRLRILSFTVLLFILLHPLLTACTPDVPDSPDTPDTQPPPKDEYTLPREDGYNQITFYWAYSGEIKNADVWVWWDGKDGQGYLLHECEYGAKAVVNVPVGIDRVGFIVRRNCSDPGGTSWGTATKDFEEDRFAPLSLIHISEPTRP